MLENWDLITNVILGASLLCLATLAVLGGYQLIARQSLKAVDTNLLAMFLPLVLMVIIYFMFDKILILNTRPDGSGEPSFPSTHVMVAATIFGTLMVMLPKYISNRVWRYTLIGIIGVLIILMMVGRVLANKHWVSDVIGGLIFAGIFVVIYYFLCRKLAPNPASKDKTTGGKNS